MKAIFLIILMLCNIIAFNLGCSSKHNYEKVPDFAFFTDMIASQTPEDKWEDAWGTFGEVDSISITAQTLYDSGPISVIDLIDSLKLHLKSLIPDLVIVEGLQDTDASILIQLDMNDGSDNYIYGFSRIEFTRAVQLLKTGFEREAQVWDDIIPICEKDDPIPRIWWALELHAKKFAALWYLTNLHPEYSKSK